MGLQTQNNSRIAYMACNGCIEGRIASAKVVEFLRINGWTITTDLTQADLVVFYACGMREFDESASIRTIKNLQSRIAPKARFIVWGCLMKINPQSVDRVYDGPMIGPRDIRFFEKFALEKELVTIDEINANYPLPAVSKHDNPFLKFAQRCESMIFDPIQSTRTFYIQVGIGCVGSCTFCGDTCARGRIASKPIDKIGSEFERGLRLGYSQFYLIGSDLGCQGLDLGYTLPDLLREMINVSRPRNYTIVLDNVNPFFLKRQLPALEDILSSGKIGALVSPVQSGSNRILKLMGRPYTIEDWKQSMRRIHEKFPRVLLYTHFQVGFPTETDKDFNATVSLLSEVFLDYANIFKFSIRPGRPAARLDNQVPEEVKDIRYKEIYLRTVVNGTIRKIQRLFCIK